MLELKWDAFVLVEWAFFVVATQEFYGVMAGHSLLFELFVNGEDGRRVGLFGDVSLRNRRCLRLIDSWFCVSGANSLVLLELLHPVAGNEAQITAFIGLSWLFLWVGKGSIDYRSFFVGLRTEALSPDRANLPLFFLLDFSLVQQALQFMLLPHV